MNFTGLFIRRPVMTALVMMGIVLFGIAGYRNLPVSDLPNIDFPTLQVTANLPGANPDTMASSIAAPLERQFSTVPGIDTMTSTSGIGATSITIQFTLDRDIDAAAQDVQNAIAAALRKLPPGMPAPPVVQKVNPADQPILFLTAMAPTLPLSTLDQYVETLMAQRISMLSGVAQVNVIGAQKWAVHVQLDPNLLAARKIGIDEVEQALNKHNVNRPTGALWGMNQMFTVRATGQLMTADQFGDMIVTYRNGSPVRLREVGDVVDGVQNDKTASWTWTKEGPKRNILLSVLRQPGTNTVEVANRVKALLPIFRQQIPPSVTLEVEYDRSESVIESVNDVKMTLLLTIGLVVLVIFIFLRNISATAIPSLALPISVVGTFAAMYLGGYSLDNLSLMALTLSVGFVVDDAIVVLENIVRHMEMGEDRVTASIAGAREIGFTVVSMTLSLAAVFIPVLFMSGIIGRLFHEFAVTIIVAILISGFVSISLTPMLCSRYLRPPSEDHGALFRATERMFEGARTFYGWTLRGVMRHRLIMMGVAFGTLVATVYLGVLVPKGFIPPTDTRQLQGSTEARQDISFEAMKELQNNAANIVASDPNVEILTSFIGGGVGGVQSMNQGRMFGRLSPRSERKITPEQLIDSLRPKLASVTGLRTFLTNPPLVRIGANGARSLYQFTLQASETNILYSAASEFERRLRTVPGIVDVNSDMQIASPLLNVNIDRDRASALGVTADQIEGALNDAYGQPQVSTIYTPSDTYYVEMELLPKYQRSPDALGMLYVRSSTTGRLVPLSDVAQFSTSLGPLLISHFGQLPAVTVSFNLAPGVALGEAVARVQELASQVLPATITTTFQGTAAAFQSSLGGMGLLLAMAVLVIYMVLGILYESFIHPITILSGLPSAALGALATLMLFGDELNIYSFVGVIMLIGIVKKNAIMMIDFALEAQRSEGAAPADAIYEACLVRFRPIMMTTMSALVGTMPIALGLGAGGESRRPLGLAVVGGLVVSQLLTLYITPVFYTYSESFRVWLGRRKHKKTVQSKEENVEAALR